MASPAKTILLVEDEAIIALAEKAQLEKVGYRVLHALSGEMAIQMAGEAGGNINLILMDIDLGKGMYGTEAAQRILKAWDIPILFLSSHTEIDTVQRTEEITNYGYVVKSSTFTVLDASIKMALKLFAAQQRINRINMDFEATNEELRVSLDSLQDTNTRLASSNEKFTKIFQSNPDYVAISCLEDGTYIDVNEGFVEMMGYSKEEVVGRSALDPEISIWADPADRRRFVELLRRDQSLKEFRTRLKRKDGSAFPAVASARVLEIEGRQSLIAVVKDVSIQDKALSALKESEERFRLAMDATTDGLWDWNGETNAVYYNPAYTAMLGYSIEEFMAAESSWLQHIHPSDRAYVKKVNDQCEQGDIDSFAMEFRIRAKDGSWKWVNSRGKAVGHDTWGRAIRIVGTHVDITERKHMEILLRDSEAKYRLLFDNAGDAIFIHSLQGRIMEANSMAQERLGYSRDELISRHFSQVEAEEEAPRIEGRMEQILKDGFLEFRTVHRRRDGGLVPTEANARLIEWEGRPAILSTCRDISGKLVDEAKIGELLREKDLVLREAHHRIKNNMATLAGYISLRAETCVDPQASATLRDCISQARGMEVLLDKLYRGESVGELDLRDYLPALMEEILGLFPATSVDLELRLEEIHLDAKRLSTLGIVVNELITNSMKYAFGGIARPAIFLVASRRDGLICLVYEDNGRGLPEGFSIEASQGFGIQLIQALASQLGGRLEAGTSPKEGGGARFAMEFRERL